MDRHRLRIALFSDSALPILNGVSISIDMLVRGLRERGHSVHIWTAAHFGYRDSDPSTYRFPAFPTPWTKQYPLAFPPFYPMLRHFRRQTYDVVHTHTPFTIGFVGLRWAQSHELPVVSTYHTLYDKYAHYIPFVPKRYVRYKIAKHTHYYYNEVDEVITPSEAAQRWLLRHSVRTPITVIPTATGLPVDDPLLRSETRRHFGVAPDQRVLLYVGRIAREKNMGALFHAAALLFRDDPSLWLWLVGDGPYRDACAEMARNLGIGDRVRFLGFVPRAEVDAYYAGADLFVFPSMTETQGLVVAEAMSHGLPAIVVHGGGAGNAVQDGINGYLVRNDPEVIADRVRILLDDEARYRAFAQAARQSVRGNSEDRMVDRVVEIYLRALGAPTVAAGVR
ncbi:MAG TPA: glycosyltransferase family 4 protein [Fimbriimonadaceae bacterium]|nr:glycosyltransferase family 4 protein [Fimbriimonadaceae bacterium]